MTELFPESEISQKSPRLLWMEKNDFHTKYRKELHGSDLSRWEAYVGDYQDAWTKHMNGYQDPFCSMHLAIGRTESEAMRNLCDNRGIDCEF